MSGHVIEKDWITGSGLRAVAVLIPSRHRCGYVEIPEDHPMFGKHYDDVRDKDGDYIDVHGGLTYDGAGDYPAKSTGHWYGFDCAHLGDASLDAERNKWMEGGEVRTMEYVVRECERLAKQFGCVK